MNDQSRRDQIANDLDLNLLVEASAGTGKTHCLTARLVNGLVCGRYQAGNTAAVTFTRKAAAELRSRVRRELEKTGDQAALAQLDGLFVGTIHSFCAGLLRAHPVEAGLSPGFRELEEYEDVSLQREEFQRYLEEVPGRGLQAELALAGARPEQLLDGLHTVCANGEVEYPVRPRPRPDWEASWSATEEFAWQLQLPEWPDDKVDEKYLTIVGRRFLNKLRAARPGLANLLRLLEPWERQPQVLQRLWGENKTERRARFEPQLERVNRFRETQVLPFLAEWRAYLYAVCMPHLLEVRARLAESRRRLALVNYHDLLMLTARMLSSQPAVRPRLRHRFAHLLVDEFQDTDPLQAEVLFWLASDDQSDDWRQLRPRPGSLFIVGDPKQSIYRFRRADIETYELVSRKLRDSGGKKLSLTTSFRSVPAICEWVNQTFCSLLTGNGQAVYSPLEAHEAGQGQVLTLSEQCHRFQDVTRRESQRVAELISSMVASGQRGYGDFLLLTWRRRDLRSYARALEELGIPVEVTGSPVPIQGPVALLFDLFGVLADPRNSIAVVGLLRGSLFGQSDEDLYGFHQAGGHFVLGHEQPGRVGQLLARLQAWRNLVERQPLGAALERVLEESGLIALASAQGAATDLMQWVTRFGAAAESGRSLSELLLEAQAADPPESNPGQAPTAASVRLMNLHQAKGLQARVVLLLAPTGGFPVRVAHRVVRGPRGALGYLRLGKYRPLAQPLDWPSHEAEEKVFLEAERKRLLYVAATRAKEVLVVSRWAGEKYDELRPWLPLNPYLADCAEIARPTQLTVSPTPVLDSSGLAALSRRLEARTRLAEPGWRRSSVTGSLDESRSLPLPESQSQAERPDSGAAWGNLLHRLLEQLVRRPELSRA
ncbi:MAG: UvrD-helicase domain-containing protein, partial [Vulcanimicrobiota bacterium]